MNAGIVIALYDELNTLTLKKLKAGCVHQLSDKLCLIVSGAGADNAKTAAEALVQHGVKSLISWGCAAGLSADLKPGALVLADQLVTGDMAELKINDSWLRHANHVLSSQNPFNGSLAEAKDVVFSAADKYQLRQKTKAVALDMESAAIARVAYEKKLPFLAVRAIADPQAMDLPKAINQAIDPSGQVSLVKLLIYLMKNPKEIPSLLRLGGYFKVAKNTLKQVATELDKLIDIDLKAA